MSLKFGEQLSTSTIKGRSQVESLLKLYREISVASKQSYFVDEFRSTRQLNSNSNGLTLWLQQFPKFIFEISLGIGAAALVAYQVWINDASDVIGVLFVFFALLSRKENLRKHAMHAAVLVALISLFGTIGSLRFLPDVFNGTVENPAAKISQSVNSFLSIGFIVFAVRSFIQARRARSN